MHLHRPGKMFHFLHYVVSGVDVLDLLQIKSFAKPKDFGTFRETFAKDAKDPDIYNITLKSASS